MTSTVVRRKTYQRMIEEMGSANWPCCLEAFGQERTDREHHRHFPPATTAVNASPIPGPSLGKKKTELLEGGLRIPALISWPATYSRGPSTTEQVSHRHGTGCQRFSPLPARNPIQPIQPTA